MSLHATAKETCDKLRLLVRAQIRTGYPHLGDAALERILTKTTNAINKELEQQQTVIATTNSRTRLLSLPAELRNSIYSYVLGSPCKFNIGCTALGPPPPLPNTDLLNTCKQIRNEALGIYWEDKTVVVNTCEVHDYASDRRHFVDGGVHAPLHKMGKFQAALLKNVVIRTVIPRREGLIHLEAKKEQAKKQLNLAQFGVNSDVVVVELW